MLAFSGENASSTALPPLDTRAVRAVRSALKNRTVLVDAGGGWGKTTAVRSALDGVSHVWCDAGAAPDEPGALAYVLARALALETRDLGRLVRDALDGHSSVQIVAWLASGFDENRALVLDDLQCIVHDALSAEILGDILVAKRRGTIVAITRGCAAFPDRVQQALYCAARITEHDLRLDEREMAACAGSRDFAVAEITGGWPLGVHFARAAARRIHALDGSLDDVASLGALLRRYVDALSAEEREALADLALAGIFDRRLIRALGHSARVAQWIFEGAVPVQTSADGYRLHDVFATLLTDAIDDHEKSVRTARLCHALADVGRLWQAFDLARRYDLEFLNTLIVTYGYRIFSTGRWHSFKRALSELPSGIRARNPAVLSLRAWIENAEGRPESAAHLWRSALDSGDCDDKLRGVILSSLTSLYVSLNFAEGDVIDIARSAVDYAASSERLRSEISYAVALAIAGRLSEARMQADSVVAQLDQCTDDIVLADALFDVSYVAELVGDEEGTERYRRRALQAAKSSGDPRSIALAETLAFASNAPWNVQLAAIDGAEKALNAVCDPEMEAQLAKMKYIAASMRGDADWIDYLECDRRTRTWAKASDLHIRIARAMRLLWQGRFAEACALMDSRPSDFGQPAYLSRWAAFAGLCAALAQRTRSAQSLVSAVQPCAQTGSTLLQRTYQLANIHAAFADVILGRGGRAASRLPTRPFGEYEAQCAAVRELCRLPRIRRNVVYAVAERLACAENEGMANVLIAWADATDRRSVGALTPAEQLILRSMADGRSAKSIAASTGRSIETVRNHIKAIVRKMGASGQLEAVAVARSQGLV